MQLQVLDSRGNRGSQDAFGARWVCRTEPWYGRQDEAMLPNWHIQDGVGSGQATVVFTEVSEKAVIRWTEDDRKPEASRYS